MNAARIDMILGVYAFLWFAGGCAWAVVVQPWPEAIDRFAFINGAILSLRVVFVARAALRAGRPS